MSEGPAEQQLLRAILLENCGSDAAAAQYLADARQSGAEPLAYCAHRFGLGSATVWRRAAHWAGFGFFETVAGEAQDEPLPPDHIERLGTVRTVRRRVFNRDVTFWAPTFVTLLELRRSRLERPELARRLCVVPPEAIEATLAITHSDALMDEARQKMSRLWGGMTASTGLPKAARRAFAIILVLLILLVMVAGAVSRPLLLPLVAVMLVGPGLMRLVAAWPRQQRQPVRLLSDRELPVYSVLIPLRDEAAMVPMLKRSMSALDYPAEKLDVKFVVEERSAETVAAVRAVLGDPRFRMVVVPDAMPRTKPKAINYALPLARGAHVVVYDAEDVPEPGQLRLAASLFAADASLACLQAELVPENGDENVLTALFAGEYAGLFGRLLPALARWSMPVPLGGTSNHFRTDVLRAIGGWDAANVTEDADLGVRLRRRGLRAEPFASRTYEEAPTSLRAWMAQRTRWMKGWMQTYLVHNLKPIALLHDMGWKAFAGFQVLVGGMILSSLLHTVFLAGVLLRFVLAGPGGFTPVDVWDWVSIAVLAIGYGGALAIVFSGLWHLRAWRLFGAQALLPLYWLLHSIAAMRAAVELVERPSYWAKTTHGVTRKVRGTQSVAPARLGAPVSGRSG